MGTNAEDAERYRYWRRNGIAVSDARAYIPLTGPELDEYTDELIKQENEE